MDQNAGTNALGNAKFGTSLVPGTCTLSVANIVESFCTFDPARSVLGKSLTVP